MEEEETKAPGNLGDTLSPRLGGHEPSLGKGASFASSFDIPEAPGLPLLNHRSLLLICWHGHRWHGHHRPRDLGETLQSAKLCLFCRAYLFKTNKLRGKGEFK